MCYIVEAADHEHVVDSGIPIQAQWHIFPEFDAFLDFFVRSNPRAVFFAWADHVSQVLAMVPDGHVTPLGHDTVPKVREALEIDGVEWNDHRLFSVQLKASDFRTLQI